jgi:hypothetical protein
MPDGCSQRLLNGRAQGRRDGLSRGPGAVSDVRHRRDPALCPSLVALAQLSQLHWSHCRSRTVTATGKITYCGTGCTTLTARVQRLWALRPTTPRSAPSARRPIRARASCCRTVRPYTTSVAKTRAADATTLAYAVVTSSSHGSRSATLARGASASALTRGVVQEASQLVSVLVGEHPSNVAARG